MEKWTALILDNGGPLGLTKDFIYLIASAILIPIATSQFIQFRERRRWSALRRHLGIMISYRHGVIKDTVDLLRKSKAKRLSKNPLDDELVKLQNEIGLFVPILDSASAKAVGEYWKEVNYLWFLTEYKFATDQHYTDYIDEKVRGGRANPFGGSIETSVERISAAYSRLMTILRTEWYYQWPWK
jgi:hypothetical protein